MSQLGDSVVSAIGFLSQFYHDVSRLLVSIDDALVTQGMVSLVGGQSIWDRSGDFRIPEGWMYRWMFRLYGPDRMKGNTPKVTAAISKAVFFGVYFTPKACGEPTAVWGVLSVPEPTDLFSLAKPVLLRNEGPAFLQVPEVRDWTDVPIQAKKGVISYRASPLVELKNDEVVQQTVTSGLLARFHAA
jgi:hypothetical protein